MFKYDYIDETLLVFKKEILESEKILIRIESLNRLHPISREVFLQTVKNGNHHNKVRNLCTHDSILKATKHPKPKSKKDES